MTDPLGLIGASAGGGGLRPLPGVQPTGSEPGSAIRPGQIGNAPSFKDMLLDQLREVNELRQEATEAIEDYQSGQRTDIESVMIAARKADLAFEMLLQVRNQVMDAYTEVRQIRV